MVGKRVSPENWQRFDNDRFRVKMSNMTIEVAIRFG